MTHHGNVKYKPIDNGQARILTLGEIHLATTLFNYSIRYNEVWIHRGSYLPFNLQNNMYAMTPNGEIWFQEGVYKDDYFSSDYSSQHLFLHEMMHVWQHQRGMWVRTRGAFSWAVDYHYSLDKDRLSDYGLEQQASIVSDYWLLIHYGFWGHMANVHYRDYDPTTPEKELIIKYKNVLRDFTL